MISRWRSAILTVAILTGLPIRDALAQTDSSATTRLSLIEAVQLALTSYPAIAAAERTTDQARASVGEAQAAWFPTLTAVASATRYEEPMAAYPIHGFTPGLFPPFDERLGQYGLTASATLFDGGAREAEIRRTRAVFGTAEAARDQICQQVIAQVIAAYLHVLGRREVLAAHDRRVEAMRAERRRVEQFFRQEKAAQVEILRADAALANAEAEHVRAASSLEVAVRELAMLTGLAPSRMGNLKPPAPAPADTAVEPRDVLRERALSANTTVEQSRRNLAAARAGLSVMRGLRWPKVNLTGNYLDQGDFNGHRTVEWNVGVALSYPLFTGGAISWRLDRARAASQAAQEHLTLAELRVTQEIDRALAALAEAKGRAASLARAVAGMEEVARIEKLLVETGSGTQTDYLDAEADLLAARANLIEARHGEMLARVELARLTGELNVEWVARLLEGGA